MTDGDAARWARMLEKLKHRGDGKLPGLVGFRPVALAHARLDAELDVCPELLAPNGYLHAATVIALADQPPGHGARRHARLRGHRRAPGPHHAGVGRRGHAPRERAHDRAVPLHADGAAAARRGHAVTAGRPGRAPHRGDRR